MRSPIAVVILSCYWNHILLLVGALDRSLTNVHDGTKAAAGAAGHKGGLKSMKLIAVSLLLMLA